MLQQKLISRTFWPVHLHGTDNFRDLFSTAVPVQSKFQPSVAEANSRPAAANGAVRSPLGLQETGYLVGWNVRSLTCCVATVVSTNTMQLEALERCLQLLAADPEVAQLWTQCAGPPVVIGQWITVEDRAKNLPDSQAILARKRSANFWITLEQNMELLLPQLRDVYVCGYRYSTMSHIVLFKRPRASNYLSLKPLSFDVDVAFTPMPTPATPGHAVTSSEFESASDLAVSIEQINASAKLEERLLVLISALQDSGWHATAIGSVNPAAQSPALKTSGEASAQMTGSPETPKVISTRLDDDGVEALEEEMDDDRDTDSEVVSLPFSPQSLRTRQSSAAGPPGAVVDPLMTPGGLSAHSSLSPNVARATRKSRAKPSASVPAANAHVVSASLNTAAAASTSPVLQDALAPSDETSVIRRRRARQVSPDTVISQEVKSEAEAASDSSSKPSSDATDPLTRAVNAVLFPSSSLWGFLAKLIGVLLVQPLHILLLLLRLFASLVLTILDIRSGVLKRTSNLANQIDRRVRDMARWQYAWMSTHPHRQHSTGLHPGVNANISFVAFYSTVMTVLIDMLAGWLIALLLPIYAEEVASLGRAGARVFHTDVLRSYIHWLMAVPAGLKLNLHLNLKLGAVELLFIDLWDLIVGTFLPALQPYLIRVLAFASLFGASMTLSLLSDFLYVFTMHIEVFHTALSRLYGFVLSSLASLFHLFNGKKSNVLRGRVDSCHYEKDQLVVGTLLFTLFFFLFPTVAAHYAFFTIVRLLVLSAQATLWWCLAFFNYFPFFPLGLYLFDPGRLPGDITFEVLKPRDAIISSAVARLASPEARSPPSEFAKPSLNPIASLAVETEGKHAPNSQPQTRRRSDSSPAELPPVNYRSILPTDASTKTTDTFGGSAKDLCVSSFMGLNTNVIPLSALFSGYRRVSGEILRHYNPLKLMWSLLSGSSKPVWRAPSVIFYTENLRIPSVRDFWRFMKAYLTPQPFA